MIIDTTERARTEQPHRNGRRPATGTWAASLLGALVAMVTFFALPHEAAAKYGSPLVTHVATAAGRGGVFLTARHATPTDRSTQTLRTGQTSPRHGERRANERLASHSDLGNGIVLARSSRPTPQIAVVQSAITLIERDASIDAAGSARFDECQCAAGQAHRLRGPPSRIA